MPRPKVWVDYQPKIYSDILKQAFKSIDLVDFVEERPMESGAEGASSIDIILISLDALKGMEIEVMPEGVLQSKVIAFSPSGEYALRRLPGAMSWEELRPFGLRQLIDELSTEIQE